MPKAKNYKLKISFLLPSDGLGGGTRAIVSFGNELISRGHQVRIFYRNTRGLRPRLRHIYIKSRYKNAPNWLKNFGGLSFKYKNLNPKMFSQDELIVSMCTQTTFDAWSLPKSIGIKVLHCHGVEIENWAKMIESWKLPMPKIAVSFDVADNIKKEVDQNVIGVVHDGVDTDEYFPCLQAKERIGIGGTFGWARTKGPNTTICVVQILGQRLPGVPIYLFGSGRKHNNLQNVIYKRLPTVAEARKLYSSCKVWFLTSIKEGFGLPVLEAMACGCAVVSTDCGGPRDIIRDGINGFLVNVAKPRAMAQKIEFLYRNDRLQKHISLNAMKTAKEFTWSNAGGKLEGYLYLIYENSMDLEDKRIGKRAMYDQSR